MEIWDLYDENRNIIGEHIRGEQLPDNGYHLVVHAWIKNSKNEFLISKRAANRLTYPLMYECVGGSVLKGESSLQGAIREIKEEVGLDIEEDSGNLIFSEIRKEINGKKFNDILDVWLFNYDGEVNLNDATTDEVESVSWLSLKEIKKLYNENKLVPTLEYILDFNN